MHCHSVYTGRLLRCNCLLVKYSSEMVQTANLHLFPYSNCMNFLQPLCKPAVLEQQVLMFGLHHMSSKCHSMLVGWFVVVGIAYMKYSSEMVQTANLHLFPYSNCMILCQPSCKPVVLNNYVLMFGLHHMGAIVTVCILVGFCVASACLKYSS